MRVAFANQFRAVALSAGLALAASFTWTAAAQTVVAQTATARPVDELNPAQSISDDVINLAAWVIASGDNRGLPFAVVDKEAAQVLVFGANGRLRGLAPALIGSAVGDDSAPGVGDRELKDIPMKDRTTPAGRFLAAYGPAAGKQTVLWIDYATAVSIHPLSDTSPRKERRKDRLASLDAEDNRITHGCINVSQTFYKTIVKPTFGEGGVFYMLPDSKTIQAAFPGYGQRTFVASATEANQTANATLVRR